MLQHRSTHIQILNRWILHVSSFTWSYSKHCDLHCRWILVHSTSLQSIVWCVSVTRAPEENRSTAHTYIAQNCSKSIIIFFDIWRSCAWTIYATDQWMKWLDCKWQSAKEWKCIRELLLSPDAVRHSQVSADENEKRAPITSTESTVFLILSMTGCDE